MQCAQIMKRDVACVSPDDNVRLAAERMRDENIGFLPVCDDAHHAIGTVTDRDLAIRVLADGLAASTSVSDAMTRDIVCCHPDDDLRKAEEAMAKHHKSRIMCVDETGLLVGVISLSDIARMEEGSRTAQVLRRVVEREVQF